MLKLNFVDDDYPKMRRYFSELVYKQIDRKVLVQAVKLKMKLIKWIELREYNFRKMSEDGNNNMIVLMHKKDTKLTVKITVKYSFKAQYSFRPGKFTIDQILIERYLINKCLNEKK